jgi:hypothetical protein
LGSAGQRPTDAGVGVLRQTRAVESCGGASSPISVGDTHLACGYTERTDPDAVGHRSVGIWGGHRIQRQGEAKEGRDQDGDKASWQGWAEQGSRHVSRHSFEPPAKDGLSGSGRKYPAACSGGFTPRDVCGVPSYLGLPFPVTVRKRAVPSARVTGFGDRADRLAWLARTLRPSMGRVETAARSVLFFGGTSEVLSRPVFTLGPLPVGSGRFGHMWAE